MEKYQTPEIEILQFQFEDIITDSPDLFYEYEAE